MLTDQATAECETKRAVHGIVPLATGYHRAPQVYRGMKRGFMGDSN